VFLQNSGHAQISGVGDVKTAKIFSRIFNRSKKIMDQFLTTNR